MLIFFSVPLCAGCCSHRSGYTLIVFFFSKCVKLRDYSVHLSHGLVGTSAFFWILLAGSSVLLDEHKIYLLCGLQNFYGDSYILPYLMKNEIMCAGSGNLMKSACLYSLNWKHKLSFER